MTIASFHHHLRNVPHHGLFLYLMCQGHYYAHGPYYNLFDQHHPPKLKVGLSLNHRGGPLPCLPETIDPHARELHQLIEPLYQQEFPELPERRT